jgi:hypothetical protein
MEFIILCAFANFFFIYNMNSIDSGPLEENGFRFIREYTDSPIANSILEAYLISLGEFTYLEYSNAKNKTLIYCFFTLATFVCMVVFMNMLIAIMADTFANVKEEWVESALYEQV